MTAKWIKLPKDLNLMMPKINTLLGLPRTDLLSLVLSFISAFFEGLPLILKTKLDN